MRKTQLILLSVMLFLAGCQSQSQTASAETDFCLIAKPFYWSKDDTAQTIEQAKKINAIGIKLCNWKP